MKGVQAAHGLADLNQKIIEIKDELVRMRRIFTVFLSWVSRNIGQPKKPQDI